MLKKSFFKFKALILGGTSISVLTLSVMNEVDKKKLGLMLRGCSQEPLQVWEGAKIYACRSSLIYFQSRNVMEVQK